MSIRMFRLIFGTVAVIAVYTTALLFEIPVINVMAFISFALVVDITAKNLIIDILIKNNKELVKTVLKAVEESNDNKTE